MFFMVQYKVVYIGGSKLILGENINAVAQYMAAVFPDLWVISIVRFPYFNSKV